jgi:hypothetical protein
MVGRGAEHGPIINRCPIGFSLGKKRRASVSLMITIFGASLLSCSVNGRPKRIKYPSSESNGCSGLIE